MCLEKLLKDLAVVASDPDRPKKKQAVKSKIKVLRKDALQLQEFVDKKNARNVITNPINSLINNPINTVIASEKQYVTEHDLWLVECVVSGEVEHNPDQVCVSRPAKVDFQV